MLMIIRNNYAQMQKVCIDCYKSITTHLQLVPHSFSIKLSYQQCLCIVKIANRQICIVLSSRLIHYHRDQNPKIYFDHSINFNEILYSISKTTKTVNSTTVTCYPAYAKAKSKM